MNVLRSPELLHRSSSRLLLVDVQEKLIATLEESTQAKLLEACRFLSEGARIMGIPVIATEQYPQGLGPTVSSLIEFTNSRPEKKRFSAVECTGLPAATDDDRFQVVVAGLETHVCVLQTVLDLLASGYQTYVAIDAVAGRRSNDHDVALQRMANSGAVITTAESVLFEWCESAESPEFKPLSSLVKSRPR